MMIPRIETRHVLRKQGPWVGAFLRSFSGGVFRCEIHRATPRSSMDKDCTGFGRMNVSSCNRNKVFLRCDTCMDDSSKHRIKPSSWPQETIPKAAWLLGLVSLGWTCAGAEAASILSGAHVEPANALSLPTWAVHTSSVIEWVVAMVLMWRYAEATENQRWKGMTWGMLPFLASAMCACTWHFFYNNPELEVGNGIVVFLVHSMYAVAVCSEVLAKAEHLFHAILIQ